LIISGSVLIAYSYSYPPAFAGLIIVGIGLSAGFPIILGYVGQLYEKLSGTAFSIALVIALAGNTIINYFFGIIAHHYTAAKLPFLVIACVVCMIVILFFIKHKIAKRIKL